MKDYDEYVKKYAKQHGLTIEEAKQEQMVKNYEKYLKEENKDTVSVYSWKE